eukprot:749583-Hanusia_phi.AAC.1
MEDGQTADPSALAKFYQVRRYQRLTATSDQALVPSPPSAIAGDGRAGGDGRTASSRMVFLHDKHGDSTSERKFIRLPISPQPAEKERLPSSWMPSAHDARSPMDGYHLM